MPRLLARPLDWLTDGEVLALVAARGLLHHDDRSLPATRGSVKVLAGLAGEAHRLITRAGLDGAAQSLGRHLVSVSRFGAAPMDSEALSNCLTAAASNQAVTFTYTNLEGDTGTRHAAPQRLVLIRGEWYCVAWARILRVFRLARMADVAVTKRLPTEMPTHIPSTDIDELLAQSFFATGSQDVGRRQRVVLGVCPGAWPFIMGRTWGLNQKIDEHPAGLPNGWRRLSFTTTGLDECRHWVLSMGAGLRAEEPVALVEWIKTEATVLLAAVSAP